MNIILLQSCAGAANAIRCSCKSIATTNCQDVAQSAISALTILFLCAAFVVIITYGINRYFKNKEKEREYQEGKESQKRTWEVEDKGRKERAELLNKKLQLLNDLCYDDKKLRALNSSEVEEYLSALDEALGIPKKPQPTNSN